MVVARKPELKKRPSLLRQRSTNPATNGNVLSWNSTRLAFLLGAAALAASMDGGYQADSLFDGPTPKGSSTPKACTTDVMIKLQSQEGEVFEVPQGVLMKPDGSCQSTVIGTMIEDSGTDEEIPLMNVKVPELKKIIEYMQYHSTVAAEEIQKPLKSTNLVECGVSEWDAKFVEIEQEQIFALILAANYLDMKELLDLTCAKIASMIKGKNTEEIRKQFNIVNDFTPEEEAQIAEENRWVEDK